MASCRSVYKGTARLVLASNIPCAHLVYSKLGKVSQESLVSIRKRNESNYKVTELSVSVALSLAG